MAEPTQSTQIVRLGLLRLTSLYANQKGIVGMLKTFLQQSQKAENAFFPALAARRLATVTLYEPPTFNAILDVIGLIVGQPRLGMSDADYQTVLYLRVAVNRSTGRIRTWSQIAAILLQTSGGPAYFMGTNAFVYLFVGDMALDPNIVANVIGGAAGLGIGMKLAYSTWPDGNDFEWCSIRSPSTTGQGTWGSVRDPSVGGLLVACATGA